MSGIIRSPDLKSFVLTLLAPHGLTLRIPKSLFGFIFCLTKCLLRPKLYLDLIISHNVIHAPVFLHDYPSVSCLLFLVRDRKKKHLNLTMVLGKSSPNKKRAARDRPSSNVSVGSTANSLPRLIGKPPNSSI
jgi:hypothetical protein